MSFSQTLSDSLEFILVETPANNLSTGFNKQINTYHLNSSLKFNRTLGNLNINLGERYNSTYIRANNKSIRDEQFLSLSGAYKIKDYFRFGVLANNNIFSDNRKIEINQASLSSAILFGQVLPHEKIIISPFWGYINNRQIGENDNGFTYGGEGLIKKINVADLDITSEMKFKNEDISPRKNYLRYFDFLLSNDFNNKVANNIEAKYLRSRKDFYYEADSVTSREFNIANNIQSRIETNYLLQDNLNLVKVFDIFSLDMLGRAAFRSIDRDTRYRSLTNVSSSIFDTKINELKIEFESMASYKSKNFNSSLRFQYSERDEKHVTKNLKDVNNIFYEKRSESESMKNNNSVRAAISFLGTVKFSDTDKLYFSILQNKLKYDTPSPNNFDDRDELLSIIRIKYSKQLTPFFETFINTEGTYNHIVYLFSQKSSNNNINRILKLAAGGSYSGKNYKSLNMFEVSANYTVYDFEDISPNYRSYSFRQYTATDSTTLKLFRNINFGIYGYVKLSEQGDFKWASFSTKPTRYLQEIFSEPKFIITLHPVLFSVGMRYFSLKTFEYKNFLKVPNSDYLSIGPSSEIDLMIKERLYLSMLGWYEFITVDSGANKEQANFTLQVNWSF